MEVLPDDQFVVRIDGSRRLRLYNAISTIIDTKTFHGWRQPSSQEDNASHQSPDSPSMFSNDLNNAMRQ